MERHFNFSIAAHINHGKTTISDFLLKAAGLMQPENAGLLMALNNQPERKTGYHNLYTRITSSLSTIKIEHISSKSPDTPGHLSFTGKVSPGTPLVRMGQSLVDALEGVMTQTETNVRLSVGQKNPGLSLFINKVGPIDSQLKLEPKRVYARIDEIVQRINDLIHRLQPEGMDWTLAFATIKSPCRRRMDGRLTWNH